MSEPRRSATEVAALAEKLNAAILLCLDQHLDKPAPSLKDRHEADDLSVAVVAVFNGLISTLGVCQGSGPALPQQVAARRVRDRLLEILASLHERDYGEG